MKHIISPLDLSVNELADVLDLASQIIENPKKYAQCCHGKKISYFIL